MQFFISIAITLIALIANPLTLADARAETSPSQFETGLPTLANLPLIRVGVTEAAVGNGHQSASANVVTRLRAMGYTGEIEVIYAEKVREQMPFLLPPFQSVGPSVQYFANLKLKFVSHFYFINNSPEFRHSALAILGADDYSANQNDYKSEYLLALQPYRWHRTPSKLITHNHVQNLDDFNNLGQFYETHKPTDLTGWLNSQLQHEPKLAEKILGLRAVLSKIDEIDFAPIYGHGVIRGQIADYTDGLLKAHDLAPHYFKKKKVLLALNEIPDEHIEAHRIYFQNNDRVQMARIQDNQVAQQIANLKPEQALILFVGPVSKPVFEYLYQQSTLPPLVKGMNSIDLMRQIGRPYLPSDLKEGYPFMHFSSILEAAFLRIASATGRNYTALAPFFIETRRPESELVQVFKDNATDTQDMRQDKLYRGLALVESILSRITIAHRLTHNNCNQLISIKNTTP